MKQIKKYTYVICLILSACCGQGLLAITIGSDTNVDRFSIPQILQDGDRVAGFASIDNGFFLLGSTTSALFDSFMPVEGGVGLSGGTLTLNKDLIFHNTGSIASIGNIIGNSHVIELSPCMTCIPDQTDIFLGCGVTFLDSVTVPQDVETLDWSYDGKFVAVGMGSGSGDKVRTYELSAGSFVFRDGEAIGGSTTEVVSVRWHPTALFLAVARQQTTGAELLIYSVDSVTGIMTLVSSEEINDTVDAIAWHPTGDYIAVGQDTGGNEVTLYSVTAGGILSASPVATYNIASNPRIQTQAMSWDATGVYLAIGTSQNGGNSSLYILEFDSVGPSLSLNVEINTVEDVRAVSWNLVQQSILAIGLDSDVSNETIFIYEHNAGAGTLINQFGTGDYSVIRSIHWSPDGDCLAVGKNDDIDPEVFVYAYNPSTFVLTGVSEFESPEDVETIRWSPDSKYLISGNDFNTMSLYERNKSVFDGSQTYEWRDIKLFLNCNVKFKDCTIKFSGNSVLAGRGNCLTLCPTCTFLIDEGANLLIKDITIDGVGNSNIVGLDSISTMSLKNVEFILDEDYSFTTGRFDVLGDFQVTGSGKVFAYESLSASNILSNGSLILNNGVTFYYNPSINNRELLQFADSSSQLILNSALFNTSSVGIDLLRGSLVIDGKSRFVGDVVAQGSSTAFGDGLISVNNMCIEILPAACLELLGYVEHKNI